MSYFKLFAFLMLIVFCSRAIDLLQYSILVDDLGLFQGWSRSKNETTSVIHAFLQVVVTSPGFARDVSSMCFFLTIFCSQSF